MGYYIETNTAKGKAKWLVENAGAVVMDVPAYLSGEHTTVCVVDNGPFEAAAIAYNLPEFQAFGYPDGRPRTWLKVPTDEVVRLCPFVRDALSARPKLDGRRGMVEQEG